MNMQPAQHPSELIEAMKAVLEGSISSAINRDTEARRQVVLDGIPDEILRELFLELTSGGTSNWLVNTTFGQKEVIVLHVASPDSVNAGSNLPGVESRPCGWDYAVGARNSWPLVAILVSPEARASRQESISTATESLGPSGVGELEGLWNASVWTGVVDIACARLTSQGIPTEALQWGLRRMLRESARFSLSHRRAAPWRVMRDLLGSGVGPTEACAILGFSPSSAGTVDRAALEDADAVLAQLHAFLKKEGVTEGINILANTPTGQGTTVTSALGELRLHLLSRNAEGMELEAERHWVHRVTLPVPPWWSTLNTGVITNLLHDVGSTRRPQRLQLQVANSLNRSDRLPGEPFIVRDAVDLRSLDQSGTPVLGTTFTRGTSTTSPVVPSNPNNTSEATDALVPQHQRRIRYRGVAPRHEPGITDVVSLQSFGCGGTARVAHSTSNSPPEVDVATGAWSQEITLDLPGAHEVSVLYRAGLSSVEIVHGGSSIPSTRHGQEQDTFLLTDIEAGDTATVTLRDLAGAVAGTWAIEFQVEEGEDEHARSHFEALVRAHQSGKRQAGTTSPSASELRRIEGFVLSNADGWKPVLAGWASAVPEVSVIDWSDPRLGNLRPSSDPRPQNVAPPTSLLQARESLRQSLVAQHLSIPEINLGDETLTAQVSAYLDAYLSWLDSDPTSAAWFDCVAVYGSTPNPEAGTPTATGEPVAVLLSPLHPVRLSWHHLAQKRLAESLQDPCPAAGLLDPHRLPDMMGLPISRVGGIDAWRAFVSFSSGESSWALMVNRNYLGARQETRVVLDVLASIGFSPRSMGGGFSSSQTSRTLDEVTSMLPGRYTLRVGIVGKDRGGSSAVDGILEWSEERFSGDTSELLGPRSLEVHDARVSPAGPSPGELDRLHETTGEKVRWYRHDPGHLGGTRDLTIVDQLNVEDPHVVSWASRSPSTRGGLFRVRIREDFEGAGVLRESRIGLAPDGASGLEAALQGVASKMEELALRDDGASHVQYQPNQDVLRERLDQSVFVAVSSNKLDPACFTRGVQAHRGYLWDFEIPELLGSDEEGAGFFLLARATESMAEAVRNSTSIISRNPPRAEELLMEISRRGIPVLKRLAAGGTRSRGELGVLLAAKFLQDAFGGNPQPPRLPPSVGECVNLVVPVDSYDGTFARLAKALGHSSMVRPDLLVLNVRFSQSNHTEIRVVPVEVKFRDSPMNQAALRAAQGQAELFGKLLKALWVDPPLSDLWRDCSASLLATILDQAFRVYADPAVHGLDQRTWTVLHQRALLHVLGGEARIQVDPRGRLLAFDQSATTMTMDLDADGVQESVRFSASDSESVLCAAPASAGLEEAFGALSFVLTGCGNGEAIATSEVQSTQVASVVHQPSVVSNGIERPPSIQTSLPPSLSAVVTRAAAGEHLPRPPSANGEQISVVTSLPRPATHSPSVRVGQGERPLPQFPFPPAGQPPRFLTGWRSPTSRWAVVGRLPDTREPVALDLDNPKVIGVFGFMGSGKSYLLGDIIETAVVPIDRLNALASPLAVVVFNYRRAASDRFELASLAQPNCNNAEVERLLQEYSTVPRGLPDVRVFCLPGQLAARRAGEYAGIVSEELFFRPDLLEVEDWELLMGQPGSEAVFAQVIRHSLRELRAAGPISIDALQRTVVGRLTGSSRNAAQLRFELVRQFVSQTRGIDFSQVVAPGRVTIVDLRDPLFNKEDALRFFLVCANSISRIQGLNKMVIFDEAHEYMSDLFADLLNSRIRLIRHEGVTYVFATQDVGSIPLEVRRFLTTRFVFDLGTAENVTDLTRVYPEFEGIQLRSFPAGQCLLQDKDSVTDIFQQPRMIRVRPRVSQHGGASRIFSTSTPVPSTGRVADGPPRDTQNSDPSG